MVNIYFCRGLSGNNQRRPTCQVYIGTKGLHITFLECARYEKTLEINGRRNGPASGRHPHPSLGACPGGLANWEPPRGSCLHCVTEPPNYDGPHVPVIVIMTFDNRTYVPHNLKGLLSFEHDLITGVLQYYNSLFKIPSE
jgi:hypothetical protein